MSMTKEDLKAAKAIYREKMQGDPLTEVSLHEQLHAVEDEVSYTCGRLDQLAQNNKIAWGFATVRKKHLRAAVATLRALNEAFEAENPERVQPHVDDGTEIPL